MRNKKSNSRVEGGNLQDINHEPTAVTYPEGLVDTQHPHSGSRTRLVLADAITAYRDPEAIGKNLKDADPYRSSVGVISIYVCGF